MGVGLDVKLKGGEEGNLTASITGITTLLGGDLPSIRQLIDAKYSDSNETHEADGEMYFAKLSLEKMIYEIKANIDEESFKQKVVMKIEDNFSGIKSCVVESVEN